MSPEHQSKLQTDQQFDELAYRTASICREIRRLRDDIARLASEERTQSREPQVADLISQVAKLEAEQETLFPVIKTEILQIVDALGVKGNSHKELVLESEAKVRLNLHKFALLDNAKNPGGAKFRGWLRTLIKREHVNAYRLADKGSVQKLNRRFSKEMAEKHGAESRSVGIPVGKAIDGLKSDKRRGVERDEVPVRQLPERFTEEEEEKIEALPEQCQALFLFSTGLWPQLSVVKQQRWADAQASGYELTRLTAIARANRFVLRSVEDDIAHGPVVWEADHETQFQLRIKKKANVVAQNLNRHFWKFMQLDTAWQYLFAFIEPFDAELVAEIEATLDSDLMLAYLHCDVYMLCDTASRCFDWLDRCGFENSILHNLGRVAGQKSFINITPTGSQRRTNEKKWEYACHLAARPAVEIEADEFIKQTFTERDGPHGRSLPLAVAAKRHCVDLPLAFERIPETELREDRYEANDE